MIDFTYDWYRAMVAALRGKGYVFAGFADVESPTLGGRPYALMRHDVDLSLEHAERLAFVEADLGLASTYFYMVRNDFYNVFSKTGTMLVKKVLEYGHRLGLHFDCAAYPEMHDPASLAEYCASEASLLSNWFGAPVTVVSYHRPQPIVLSGDPRLSYPLPHTYMSRFVKEIRYLSDSHGRWKMGSPLQAPEFHDAKSMHILTHPLWWAEAPGESLEKLDRFLDRKHHDLKVHLAHNCTIYPPPPAVNGGCT